MDEYNDIDVINDLYKQNKNRVQIDPIGLTIDMNKKIMNTTGRSMELDIFKLFKDQIRNYRPLNRLQLLSLEHLSEKQKIEIILLYNEMFLSLEELLK